jgi:5,10-methylenetetrahydromethanopterin reductase
MSPSDALAHDESSDERLQLNELGFYVLAGAPKSPVELLEEVPAGESLGLGSTFISERFNIKEAVTLSGAVAASSRTLGIATAATNHNTRHPAVTASYATTMHRLTGGRFTLGIGRGIEMLFDAFGIPRITGAQIEDFVGLMRRLFRGEMILGHDGPAGRFPVLVLDSSFDEEIPIGFVAFGPNSLRLAGRVMDMVVLHTFFTDETTERCVTAVREAAEAAGRDPSSVRIWSCYATVHDGLPEDLRLKKTVGRLSSYLQGYGDLLVKTNGWDPAPLERFRADPVVASFPGAIDDKADTATLEHIATLLPDEWLEPAATGSPQRCAERVLRQFDLGVDGVIMHGATPDQLAPVVESYRAVRPVGRFDGLDANPGR